MKLTRENVRKFPFKEMGIYKIKCMKNRKVYIGQSVNMSKRLIEHIRELDKGAHSNRKMQSSYDKYGRDSFYFEILEVVEDRGDLTKREKYWASEFNAFDNEMGFNLCPIVSCESLYKKEFAELVMGSKNGNSKLKEEDVVEICQLVSKDSPNYTDIGRKYGVSRNAITSIVTGRTWKNISNNYLSFSN